MEEELCECTVIHEDVVKKVKKIMPDDGLIYDIAELFKVFADSTRMKIIYALMENELCVCDIANIVQTTQSAISHQLRILKQSKLVRFRKEYPEHKDCILIAETIDNEEPKYKEYFQVCLNCGCVHRWRKL